MIIIRSRKYNLTLTIPKASDPVIDSKDYLVNSRKNIVDPSYPGETFSYGDLIIATKKTTYIFHKVNAAFDFPYRIQEMIRQGADEICVIVDLEQLNPQIGFEMEDFLVMERREIF